MYETRCPAAPVTGSPGHDGQSGDAAPAAGAGFRLAPGWSSAVWLQVGHQLRTPLNGILGNVELLLDGSAGPLSAQARLSLGDVQSAGRELMAQVRLMLLLLQIAAARAPGADAPLDLLQLIGRAFARSTGTSLGWHVRPGQAGLVVRGDPFWLDALAQAVAAPPAGQDLVLRIRIERPRRRRTGEVCVCLCWTGFDHDRLPPMALVLIDAILRGHGGHGRAVAARGLCFNWPAARVVFA